jgi:hypothetical protein
VSVSVNESRVKVIEETDQRAQPLSYVIISIVSHTTMLI